MNQQIVFFYYNHIYVFTHSYMNEHYNNNTYDLKVGRKKNKREEIINNNEQQLFLLISSHARQSFIITLVHLYCIVKLPIFIIIILQHVQLYNSDIFRSDEIMHIYDVYFYTYV